ncbi:MAG: YciI family protein [Bacteroidota bacterium]
MEEFLLIFRRDFTTKEEQPSPDQMQNHLNQWQEWFAGPHSREQALASTATLGSRWQDREGRKNVINGPYAEIKESIGGMVFVKASGYDEAVEIANGCPILEVGGNVEIRRAVTPGKN